MNICEFWYTDPRSGDVGPSEHEIPTIGPAALLEKESDSLIVYCRFYSAKTGLNLRTPLRLTNRLKGLLFQQLGMTTPQYSPLGMFGNSTKKAYSR